MNAQKYFNSNKIQIVGFVVFIFLTTTFVTLPLFGQESDKIKDTLFYEIEIAMQNAQQNEVPAFAPTFFAKALELYKRAGSDYKKGDRVDKIRKTLKEAIEVLNEGSAVARVSKVALADAYKTRKEASQQEYIKLASNKFAKAEKKYQEAILKAEAWDFLSARKKAEESMLNYCEMILIAIEKGPIKKAEERLVQSKKAISRERYEKSVNELKSLKNYVENAKVQRFDIATFIDDVHNKIDAIMGPARVATEDIELQKIEESLSKANRYKTEALLVICEIKCGVDIALLHISECPSPPPPDPLYVQPSRPGLPMFGVLGALDALYMAASIASCEGYSRNTQIAAENAKRHLDYLKSIISQVNEIKNLISRYRSDYAGLTDSEKSSLQGTLSSFKTDGQNEEDDFDRFIRDIEGFREDYKRCNRNRVTPLPLQPREIGVTH